MSVTLSFDSVSFAQRLKAAQVPEPQIQVEAQALREAFDARDKYTKIQGQELQAQAATLQVLQDAVQKLHEAQARHDAEYAASRKSASDLSYQVKALEENARRDAKERASKADVEIVRAQLREVRTELKGDIALVREELKEVRTELKGDIALVRKEMELGFADAKADTALLRKDVEALGQSVNARFEAMENHMVTRLTKVMIAIASVIGVVIAAAVGVLRMV